MPSLTKNWDRHVAEAEEVARGPGFQELRDRILAEAAPRSEDRVLDVGAGTGLLTLALGERVDHVWAIDISPAMCEYLRAKAESAGLENVQTAVGSAVSLPLVDESVDIVVSNYCLHHLRPADKLRALGEMRRVLVPGGHLVVGDMMFGIGVADSRDRALVLTKSAAMLRRGPAGVLRLVKNALRLVTGRWERPARPDWWRRALQESGFERVGVESLPHEGGIAQGRKPGKGGPGRGESSEWDEPAVDPGGEGREPALR